MVPAVSSQKLRVNYASEKCGAKIVAFNPEMENGNHMLTSNKDEYMINPCSAKKWWVCCHWTFHLFLFCFSFCFAWLLLSNTGVAVIVTCMVQASVPGLFWTVFLSLLSVCAYVLGYQLTKRLPQVCVMSIDCPRCVSWAYTASSVCHEHGSAMHVWSAVHIDNLHHCYSTQLTLGVQRTVDLANNDA